jgi:hypothetical protein
MTLPTARGVEPVTSVDSAISSILTGKGILLLDGVAWGLTLSAQKTLSRPVQGPTSELTVLGPQVGLTESLEESIGLIRTACARLTSRSRSRHREEVEDRSPPALRERDRSPGNSR